MRDTMERKLDEWIKIYEKKTGEEFKPSDGFKLFFFPTRGFAEIRLTDKMVIIAQLCGDMMFWRNLVEFLSQAIGYEYAGTYCIRNIKAYIRLCGFTIIRTETLDDGLKRYFCIDKHGKKGQASPAWISNNTGHAGYYITWEV